MGALDRTTTTSGAPVRRVWAQLREGWAEMIRNRFVLVTTILTTSAVIAIGGLQGIILPLYFTEIDRPGLLGLVMSAIAAGSLVSGGIYAAAGARGSRRAWFVTGSLGSVLGLAIVATLMSVWVLFAGAFVLGFSVGLFGALVGCSPSNASPRTSADGSWAPRTPSSPQPHPWGSSWPGS
ncbi:hypothetical protein [Nesterenkonia pannonica]|uniref:hypothetical protein n=1 Tax=Nesterenkonia pannonica TaxID=1548602 RepID=UPI002164E7BA|nr:hypothetical protein [Nesterenkonia pannonica]